MLQMQILLSIIIPFNKLIKNTLIRLQYLLVKIADGYMENVLNLNEQKNVMSH